MSTSKLCHLLFGLLLFIGAFGQKNKISGEIEYEQLRITATGEEKQFYTLHFNAEESYYEENIFEKFKKSSIQKSDGTTIFQPRDDNNPQFYYLSEKGELYFSQFQISEHLFVRENEGYKVKWKITGETKEIGRFKCQKAIGDFRGRTYHAWFTSEVALSFGPWKLNGLPGLILEAYDESDYIYFTAKKVSVLSNNSDSSEYIRMKTTDLKYNEALTIDKFLARKDELVEEYFEKLSARLPKGVGPLTVDKDCNDCGESWETFN